MKSIKRKTFCILMVIFLTMITAIIYVESRPFSTVYSSVFSTVGQTEIQIYVLMNTLGSVDERELAEEVVLGHQKVNGIQENPVYTLKMYRTFLHYRGNWEYDTIICDENGAIICCKDDLRV